MGQLMVEADGIASATSRQVIVTDDDDAEAMRDLLAEALNAFLIDGFIWCEVNVAIAERTFVATLGGEPFDQQRHHLIEEIKAVTYHRLCVERSDAGWRAVIVFDA